MPTPHLDHHERTFIFIALLQDIHAMRAELARLENIVQEMREYQDDTDNSKSS